MSMAAVEHPPLGWNSYDGFNCHIYEELAIRELEAFKRRLAPAGYEYFVIDNGWFSDQELVEVDGLRLPSRTHAEAGDVRIDEWGIVQPSNTFFPNGFAPLTEYCHAHGLKFGVHLMRGVPRVAVERNTPVKGTNRCAAEIADVDDTCGWCPYMYGVDVSRPGSQEYYDGVLAQFAGWGIDFVKVDDVAHRPAEIEAYAKAIEKCDRPIALSLSPGGDVNKAHLDTFRRSHMVRTTGDVWDRRADIDKCFRAWRQWQGLERAGFYPDLDMVPFGELCLLNRETGAKPPGAPDFSGNAHHWCRLSEAEKETFITMRALAASPIMAGGSLVTMDEHSLKLLTDPHMLACTRNGITGRLVHERDGVEVWLAPERALDRAGAQRYKGADAGWLGVFNRRAEAASAELRRNQLGLIYNKGDAEERSVSLREIWRDESRVLAPGDALQVSIEPYGVRFMSFETQD